MILRVANCIATKALFFFKFLISIKRVGGDVSSFSLLVVLYIDELEKCFFNLYTMIYATE